MEENEVQSHPANAVFALMDDRKFRHSVVRIGVEKDKNALSKLATGKHQVKGFRSLSKAPVAMLIPVLSDEANISTELARKLLLYWVEANVELRTVVGEALKAKGYEPAESILAEENVTWRPMLKEHADAQFEGTFISDREKNEVMLMSLLLGWFGANEEGEEEAAGEAEQAEAVAAPPKKKEAAAVKEEAAASQESSKPKKAKAKSAEEDTAVPDKKPAAKGKKKTDE